MSMPSRPASAALRAQQGSSGGESHTDVVSAEFERSNARRSPAWFVNHTPRLAEAGSICRPTFSHAFGTEGDAETFAAGLDGLTVVFAGWVDD